MTLVDLHKLSYPDKMFGVEVIVDIINRPGNQPFIELNPKAQSPSRDDYILTLHTTEGTTVTGGRVTLGQKYAAATLCGPYSADSPFPCIMPTRPPWGQDATLRDEGLPFHPNGYGHQIEMVEKTKMTLWVPQEATFKATCAYMAWMVQTGQLKLQSAWGDSDAWVDGSPPDNETNRRKGQVPPRGGTTDHDFWGDGNFHHDCGALKRTALYAGAELLLGGGDMEELAELLKSFMDGMLTAFKGGKYPKEDDYKKMGYAAWKQFRGTTVKYDGTVLPKE